MNAQQRSVTVAFVLVVAGLAVRHHWPSRLSTWAGKPAKGGTLASAIPTGGQLIDWQAAVIMYGILMLTSETPGAEMAVAIAWGIGVIELFAATGQLAKEYPALFGGAASVTQLGATPNPADTSNFPGVVPGTTP